MADAIHSPEELAAAREARGMGLQDVSRDLKLAVRQLEALERGDWSVLPGLAFVRGALRGYGRLLGVDVERLLARVSEGVKPAELRPASTLDQPLPTRSLLGFGEGGSGSRLAWAGLALLAVLALAAFFGAGAPMSSIESWLVRVQEAAHSTEPETSEAERAQPAEAQSAPVETPAVLPSAGPGATSPGEERAGSVQAGAAQAGAAQAGAAQPATTRQPGPGRNTVVSSVPIALPPDSGAARSPASGSAASAAGSAAPDPARSPQFPAAKRPRND